MRISEVVTQQLVVKKVPPEYPLEARQQHIQGSVLLRARISANGDVTEVELVSGDAILAPAAIDAVRQWKYKPYLMNGQPVPIETQVAVAFTLTPSPRAAPSADSSGAAANAADETAHVANDSAPKPTVELPQRVRVSQGVSTGLLVKKVNPDYPNAARQAQIQGIVVLMVRVDREGNVADLKLIAGHPLLAPAAIDAVKKWKYKPYLLEGRPVEVETTVQVNFTLSGRAPK